MRSITVADVQIPTLGFGTWMLTGEACAPMVAEAIGAGYRHVDTAAIYENEREVGEGIRASGVPRDRIFLTTKVWNDAHRENDFRRSAEASLKRLGVDYVDLLLIHWPVEEVPLEETLRALCRTRRDGLTRAIGISNFTVRHIEQAVRLTTEPIATNQVEYHPYLSQKPVLEALRRHGISLTAYSPLARGRVAQDPVIAEVAARHRKTPGQVTLRWLVQQGDVIAIPKTATPARARENLAIYDFELSPQEMERLHGLTVPDGRMIKPSFGPDWDDRP